MSPVRNPLSNVCATEVSILFAAFSAPRPYFNSIAPLRIVAIGFALSCSQEIVGRSKFSNQSCTIKENVVVPSISTNKDCSSSYTHKNALKLEAIITCPAMSGAEP
jgi:hypothetical protein